MREEKHYNLFTCDKCKTQTTTDFVIIMPGGWQCVMIDNNPFHLCKDCYEKYLDFMCQFMQYEK